MAADELSSFETAENSSKAFVKRTSEIEVHSSPVKKAKVEDKFSEKFFLSQVSTHPTNGRFYY